jgi:DNA-binding response OmpR family regulator
MLNQDDTDELPNILIVEDNDDMRRYLRTMLADRFYVLEASDGQSGLRLARESVPDLIVSDVMMPVMDGLQLCKQLKENFITSHIPVILLTARSEERQQMEGYESGADAYLTKPFSAEVLVSRICNLLASRRQLRQLFNSREGMGLSASAAINSATPAPPEVKVTTQDRLFMDQLKEAVMGNMANPNLKMDELGEQLGISRVQLYRKVKTLTGLSPVELLRQMRLQRALTLLNSTEVDVVEHGQLRLQHRCRPQFHHPRRYGAAQGCGGPRVGLRTDVRPRELRLHVARRRHWHAACWRYRGRLQPRVVLRQTGL